MPILPLILSSDFHVFEPPDLWQTRIHKAFRDRAPRIERIDGGDHVVVEADQILSGIGLISNAGARFEAPETISAQGRFEDVHRGGYDPQQHLKDMALDGVADVGLGLSAQRVDVPQSRKILAEIPEGVPDDEQAKIAGGNTAHLYNFDVATLTAPD
jgi:hypothetical protein